MINNIENIKAWLEQYKIKDYIINTDLTVDVNNNVDISNKQLSSIPIRFNRVEGNFFCHSNLLTNLEGSPSYIGKNFNCGNNLLTTLEYGPKEVKWHFYCYYNQITSLQHCPSNVGGHFNCEYNEIANLKDFNCNFKGSFLHKGSYIDLFEDMYVETIEFELKINYFTLHKVLLHDKLQNTIKNKDNNINNKNSIIKKTKL